MSEVVSASPPDAFERIRANYDSFSKQQKAVADYILEQGLEIAFVSCNQLAHASGTSPATVIRFTQQLGYAKYMDFVDELHGMLLDGHRPMSKLTEALSTREGGPATLEQSRALDIQSILDLADFQQEGALADAVGLLIGARRIFVSGARSAYSLAYYAGFLLREMAHNVQHFPSGAEDAYERLETASAEDVLLVVTFRRYARTSHRLAQYAAGRAVKLIAVTDGPTAPITTLADVSLLAPNTAPIYSYVAPMTVLNALIWGFAQAKSDEIATMLEQRQQMLLSQKVFI